MKPKKTTATEEILTARRENPKDFCPNLDCGVKLERDGDNITKDDKGNITQVIVDTYMGNEWWETYLCPHCNAGHKKYDKDDTPGFRESFTHKCCQCGNDEHGRGK